MSKKTIFILQDSKEFVENLKEYFLSTNEFDVVGVATDGIIAIQMIAEKKPQILITELVVSGYDGLMVINKIREIVNFSKPWN